MERKLSEQLQTLIDTVEVAEAKMATLVTTTRRTSVYVGPTYHHLHGEMARLLDELRYMRYVAERREAEQTTGRFRNKALQD